MGQLNGTIWLFCPQMGSAASPKCHPRWETLSPRETQGFLRPHYPLVGLLHRSTSTPTRLHLAMVLTPKMLFFNLCCLCKLAIINPSHFPHQWFWGSVFLVKCPVLCSLSLFLPLSFSFSLVPLIRAPYFCGNTDSFSPKITSLCLLLCIMWLPFSL